MEPIALSCGTKTEFFCLFKKTRIYYIWPRLFVHGHVNSTKERKENYSENDRENDISLLYLVENLVLKIFAVVLGAPLRENDYNLFSIFCSFE
jgi:hypothetical protein